MNQNIVIRMGFLAGVLSGLLVVVLLLKLMRKDGSLKCKYDERQQLVRGRGFQYGFFGWMIYDGVCILTDIGFEVHLMDLSMTLFSGMMVGTVIYVSYSVWHDGYFSLNLNPRRLMSMLGAMTVLNISCAAVRIHSGLLEQGVLTFFNGSNLLMAVASLLLLGVMFAKWFKDRSNPDKGQEL